MDFVTLSDFEETDVEIRSQCIEEANSYVERILKARGIDPSTVDTRDKHLKELAKTYALYKCYLYSYRDENSPYKEKADQFGKLLKELENQLTPELLGIETSTGNSFGAFRIQRGS
jgi:thymidylate synthase